MRHDPARRAATLRHAAPDEKPKCWNIGLTHHKVSHMNLVFVDPPARNGASIHPWGDIAKQLKERPGEWALCVSGIVISATTINRGTINAFKPAGSFVARTVATGKKDDRDRTLYDLYIKYLGEPEEADQ